MRGRSEAGKTFRLSPSFVAEFPEFRWLTVIDPSPLVFFVSVDSKGKRVVVSGLE